MPRRDLRSLHVFALVFVFALVASRSSVAETLFSDDFERADGPLDGWTVAAGFADIIGGQIIIGPTAEEHWLWAGDPAEVVPPNADNVEFSFDMEFLAPGSEPVVGRHGGFAFCASTPTTRNDVGNFTGYFIDWIDRTTDRGLRLTRVDVGGPVGLVFGALGSPAEPPLEWRIELTDTNILVYGDEVLLIDIADATYRGGHYGFWSWTEGQEIAWDNLVVTGDLKPVTACFDFTPTAAIAGSDVFFDARCSTAEGEIASYAWDFGDGVNGNGETIEHIFDFGDNYTVTLTVEDGDGNTDSVSRLVPVSDTLLPFEDDFERAAGPVDGWTTFQGDWNITASGELETFTGGAEHWIWAGDPPGIVSGDFVAEFDMEFLAQPGDVVGRHAGIMFYSADPTIRWQTSGYFVDWIDRPADRGVRFTRADNGALPVLVSAANSPAEPPSRWRIEVIGPTIRVYGDGALLLDIQDDTYREGHVGFWAYSNSQDVLFDNLVISSEIDLELTACIGVSGGLPIPNRELSFDGSCSVAPDGVEIDTYEWDFGDGSTATGASVTHAYDFADAYTVTLTVRAGGSSDTITRDLVISPIALDYQEDFERDDGAVDGWTSAAGDWRLESGELATGPTAAEHWIWAGDPPVVTSGVATFQFDLSFLSLGSNPAVGRHAGFQFHCSRPTRRTGAGAFDGYFIDWIDRDADRGVRLTRVDGGALNLLVPGQGIDGPLEPPLEWIVEVDGDSIRVFGDGDLLIDHADSTYRSGYFGFWTWTGDQDIRADNLTVAAEALTPCFDTVDAFTLAGTPATFDAGCSEVFGGGASIVSYAWDFGDGTNGNGETVDHTFDVADSYTVTLTVEDDSGATASVSRVITASGVIPPFADCFDGEAGPVTDWTTFAGDWNVTEDGQLSTFTTPPTEHWVWAGSPPHYMEGDLTVEFEKEYLFDPMDGVGRHAGIMIFAQNPTIRWQTSGYTVWWIDRVADFGVVIARWDNGAITSLNTGMLEPVVQPPLVWRVEVEGAFIRAYGDDTLLVEVEDDTYREGHLGLWAYSNSQDVLFDSVRVGADALPECGVDPVGPSFVRGDTNADGSINLSDGVNVLNVLFLGIGAVPCAEAGDTNGDGAFNLSDGVNILNVLFLGIGDIPPPSVCDTVEGEIDCASFPPCE